MNRINSIGLRNTIYRTVAAFTIFAFMWSASVPQAAAREISALPASKPEAACLNNGQARSANNARNGKLNFVGTDPGRAIPNADGLPANASPEAAARSYLSRCGMLFGLTDQAAELQVKQENKLENGRSVARFQQYYQGIPVMGGELVVNLDNKKNILSVGGDIFSDIYVDIQPSISAEEAAQVALDAAASKYNLPADGLQATTPELWIYDPALFGAAGTPVLVWRVDVTPLGAASPDELTLVDTELGLVVLSFNQSGEAAFSAQPASALASPLAADVTTAPNVAKALTVPTYAIQIYSANNDCLMWDTECTGDDVEDLDDATFICDQNNLSACSGDAANAYQYALDAYNFYATTHGRNSINNAGITITAYVHYGEADPVGYPNSRWTASAMIFGEGWSVARDIVGHEYTHGVTQYTSNLYAYYQSGAIGESFSDLWGEFIDKANGDATWKIGESLASGSLRDMSDPTLNSQPDKMSSTFYYTGTDDNGGIHTNSGVNNKAVYLMTDGTTDFNGSGPITGLGMTKVAQIYYEVQTNLLTSGADYADLYQALYQGCLNLVNASEITLDDCTQVQAAADAVEMNQALFPDLPFTTPDAPLCDGAQVPSDIFYDDLESDAGNFIVENPPPPDVIWTLGANNAHSGDSMFYAKDVSTPTGYSVQLDTVMAIPSGTDPVYLHFDHSFLFYQNYDGGVVEYSTEKDHTWTNASSLFTDNGYNGTITTDEDHHNPLGAVAAFVSDSHGYISSRLDLSTLRGQNVIFRWRQGTSESVSRSGVWGWYLDDIRIYTCGSAAAPGAFNKTSPANAATGQGDSITITWDESAGATEYEYCYDTSDTCNSTNTEDWIPAGTSTSKDLTELAQYSTYYWQVRAKNSSGTTTYANGSDTTSWSFTVGCYELTTNITTGPSTGTIAIDDSIPPEYCSTTDLFKAGSSVLLKAVPATDYKFLSWGSEASGTTSPLSVTMDKDLFVSAAFTLKTFTISGNAGESGVSLRYTDVTSKSVVSGSNGRYTITVPIGWSGSVTPSKSGLTFSPASRTYTPITTNRSGNYFAVRAFASTGSYDGYIVESTETSNVGSSVNSTATYFVLGDASADRQYRAILAFNTTTLPDTAVLQSVVIKIRQYGSPVGSNPFSILGNLYTDIRKGYFGSGISLQTTDFNAAASTSSVAAAFSKTPVSSWYSATFTSTGRAYINKTSWTELRLRFSKDDNDDGEADYMKFYSGNISTTSYRPQLIVTYTLP